MRHENLSYGIEKPSRTATQVWETTRLIKNASRLEPAAFWHRYSPEIQGAFPNVGTTPAEIQAHKIAQIMNHERVPVLVCARNEMTNNNIGITFASIARQQGIATQLVVVDNGSTDGTGDFAREAGAIVVNEENAGLMNALRRGFQFFRDEGYRGPILHTDADSAPLPLWAKTMTDYARMTISQGGEAFGKIFYYDATDPLLSPKNAILTAGNNFLDAIDLRKRESVRVHGGNGIIMTGPGSGIIDALSVIENPPGVAHVTDVVIRDAIKAAQGTIDYCSDGHARVITSGRRYPGINDVIGRTFRAKQTRSRMYEPWNR